MPSGDPRAQDERVVRALRIKLSLVLGLLGLLAVGSYLLFRAQTEAVGSSAGVINLCGRQRMLSQRAALLIARLDELTEEAERRRVQADLGEIADTMESHARSLLGGGPALMPPSLRARFMDSPHDLAGTLRRFVDGVRAAADPQLSGPARDHPQVARTLEAARDGSVLAALDNVVDVVQEHSVSGLARLRRAQLAAAALFLLSLVLLVALVFRPVLRDLRRHLAELRRSREALREQGRQLQLNFENAPLGIASCAIDGSLLNVNPALCRMLGAAAEELVGRPVEELLHADDYPRLAEALARPAGGDQARDAVGLRLRHRDGSWVSGLLHWSFVSDEGGAPIGWIAHFEDRTRQLEVEEQARQDRERLAQLGRLHTLGEMAAGIAHEVNQPLTAISSYAQAGRRLLQGPGGGGEGLGSILDKISGQAHRAGEVIRGLRGMVGQRRSRTERVDLNDLVRQAVALAQADANFLSLGVDTALEEGLPEVRVDTVQIQQVVLNLIRNAFDAMEGSPEAAAVRVQTRGNGDGFVEVAVRDHGPGVPEEVAARLFEPFFSSKEAGLGMGLAISRSIVSSHGGRLWWRPAEGGGASFHFTLPTD